MTSSVADIFVSAAEAFEDTIAVELDDDRLTYRELELKSRRLAAGLLGRGVGKGSRVGVLFGNGPRWLVWSAALLRAGATVVPLSTFARGPELARVIRHADLQAIVAQGALLGRDQSATLEAGLPDLPGSGRELSMAAAPFLRWVVIEGESPAWARDVQWVEQGALSEDVLRAAQAEIHSEDTALIIYTSGQSAEPKGVAHTHGAVVAKTSYLRGMLGIEGPSCVDVHMPFFWVGGLVMGLLPGLLSGATLVCHETSNFGMPIIGSGKDPANPFPEGTTVPSLGMTETFGMYSWGRQWRAAGSELAPPLDILEPGYDVKVVDGELLVRGPTVTRGLVKVERARSFDADGFFHTGDGGREHEGRLHFTGRLGDMIKTSGANVSPSEVERELCELEGVANAFVVAIDHPSRGQEVLAAVVADPGAALSAPELRDALRQRLSTFKVPRRIALMGLDELPRTPSLKIDKRALAVLIDQRIPAEDGG